MLVYNVKKEVMRIGKYKGKTMYYAAPVTQDKVTARQVEDRIINATTLSRADVHAVITALAGIMREEMSGSRIVELGTIGSFKVISSGNRMDKEKDVTACTLKSPRIQFFPTRGMLNQAKSVQRVVIREGETDPAAPSSPMSGITHEPTSNGF